MINRTKSIDHYRDFAGADVSISESLFTYGLIWKASKTDLHFIFGVDLDDAGVYTSFNWADIAIDCDIKEEYDWVNFESIYSYTGMTKNQWGELTTPQKILDLVAYYGRENVFGDSFGAFEIKV